MLDLAIRTTVGAFALDATLAAPGGVTALFGPSGAGKTSVIRAVAGLLRPAAGHIRLGERVVFDAARGINLPTAERRIGYVFQEPRLFPHMRVAENLRYGGTHRIAALIDLLDLRPLLDRRPAGLSGGEAQRVSIGRALAANPDFLLLDEPLSALDAPRRAEILPYLARLRDETGLPMLYVSHQISEIAQLADTVALIQDGRVTGCGALEDVLADPASMPLIGVRDAGAVITAEVLSHDAGDDLSTLRFAGGQLLLPGRLGVPGARLRLRVPAQDIILARERPTGLSALNVLAAQVTQVQAGRGPGVAVGLAVGETRLLARVTRRSASAMGLEPGQKVYAILKATAVARADVGGPAVLT